MRTLTLVVQNLAVSGQSTQIIENFGAKEHEFFERYVQALLQQLVEKIDRVREVAGRQLQMFFKFTA